MSPHGRPKGESLRPEAEGTPVSPHGRPKGESPRPEAEGTPVSTPLVVLVTGGARRVGRAMVQDLAARGHAVAIHYRNSAQEAGELVGELRARGCQAQAQVSGITFTMDCAQAQENRVRYACQQDADCARLDTPKHPDGWRCTDEKICWAPPAFDVKVNGTPINPDASYKIAVNDYIAKGGSGFKVLKRNTTSTADSVSSARRPVSIS